MDDSEFRRGLRSLYPDLPPLLVFGGSAKMSKGSLSRRSGRSLGGGPRFVGYPLGAGLSGRGGACL